MLYSTVNALIETWAGLNSIKIMQEAKNPNRIYFYISSQNGETFQIVVEPEKDGKVRVDAHLIESINDEEAHFYWEASPLRISNVLDLGKSSAQVWFSRIPVQS